MLRYAPRDESNPIELCRNLLMNLVQEDCESWTPAFPEKLRSAMAEAVKLEKEFVRDGALGQVPMAPGRSG